MRLDLDLAYYYSALHLPFLVGKKIKSCHMYALNDVIARNREGKSGETYFNSTSMSWAGEQSLSSTKLLQGSIFDAVFLHAESTN